LSPYLLAFVFFNTWKKSYSPLPFSINLFYNAFSELESKHEFVVKVRDVVKTWKRPVFVLMRYLFSFLNHLSEFSDENLMDPYNLAICFGPTLVPIPEERDQVQYQGLVNELIKNFIIFFEDIFPNSVPGKTFFTLNYRPQFRLSKYSLSFSKNDIK